MKSEERGRQANGARMPGGQDEGPLAPADRGGYGQAPFIERGAGIEPMPAASAATPLERLYSAAKALREEIDEGLRASQARLAALGVSAIARHAPAGGAILQQAPTPGRIRELAENPEKAIVAAGAAAVSAAIPSASPAANTAARVVEKLIDQSRDLDLDVRTR